MNQTHNLKPCSLYVEMKKKPPSQPFNRALFYFLTSQEVNSAKIISETGLSQGYVSHLKNGEYEGSEQTRRKIAEVCGFDGSAPGKTYDDFIKFGQSLLLVENSKKPDREPVHKTEKTPWSDEAKKPEPSKIKPFRQQHVCLIDLFPDEEEAYEINKKLLEIKKLDPERFDRIKEMIDLHYTQIEAKKIAGNDSE